MVKKLRINTSFSHKYSCAFSFNLRQDSVLHFFLKEPRYNEGPRDWKKCSQKARFRNIEVLFHMFLLPGCKISFDIIPRTSLHRDSLYRGSVEFLYFTLVPPTTTTRWPTSLRMQVRNCEKCWPTNLLSTLSYETEKSECYVSTWKHLMTGLWKYVCQYSLLDSNVIVWRYSWWNKGLRPII